MSKKDSTEFSSSSTFSWRGQPSIFSADSKFTSLAKAMAVNAKKLGTGLLKYPTSDSINTDTRLPADKTQVIRRGGI